MGQLATASAVPFGRCWDSWRPGSGGRLQRRIDGDQPIEPINVKHTPDDRGGDHQPQLRAAGEGTLVGTHHSICAGMIARQSRGHVRYQRGGAAVDHREQFLADLAGVGHIDVLRKRNDRLTARPPHRVSVIDHDSNPSVDQELRNL